MYWYGVVGIPLSIRVGGSQGHRFHNPAKMQKNVTAQEFHPATVPVKGALSAMIYCYGMVWCGMVWYGKKNDEVI